MSDIGEVQTPTIVCLSCGEQNYPDANWCEACGADLDAPPSAPKQPCTSCSAPVVEITDDGWCQVCGTKQPAPEDHVVIDGDWFAMVSDIGKTHRTNEDAGGAAARSNGIALVVCDGVSSTDESQHAAQAAVATIVNILGQAPLGGLDQIFVEAAHKAQAAIIGVTPETATEPPSCTLVAVVADFDGDHAEVRTAWLGDSRAYWVTASGATMLTRDHSWATEQGDLGELSADVIEADPRAHSITRWLGADSHDVTPERASARLELPGALLVCSDGLWNYADDDAAISAVWAAGSDDESPLERAERLVEFANDQGGHDNITVALASLDVRSNHG